LTLRDVSGEQLIAACQVLIHQGRYTLRAKVVIDEFERNRSPVEADMTRIVTSMDGVIAALAAVPSAG
jgi:hypothetical protein